MNRQYKLGLITIGQSPRTDITNDIKPILDDKFKLIQRGALDNLSLDYISNNISPETNDEILVSRISNGSQVTIGKSKIIPLIQQKINELDEIGTDIIALLCNDPFPQFTHKALLIKPEEVLHSMAAKLTQTKKVGVIMPSKAQLDRIKVLWNKYGIEAVPIGVSPYDNSENIAAESKKLIDDDIDLIFMECFGYSIEMKKTVEKITNKPVLLAKTLLFSIINELF